MDKRRKQMYRFYEIINYANSKCFPGKRRPEAFDEILGFAKLERYGLPVLFDFNHLVDFIPQVYLPLFKLKKTGAFSSMQLYRLANYAWASYHSFHIPKRGGGSRTIMAPNPILKEIQRFILKFILSPAKRIRRGGYHREVGWSLYDFPVSKYAKAYLQGKSLKDAARFHVGKKIVLCMDIVDFFGSISYGRVYNMFRGFGYNKGVSTLLANLCTVNGYLPQGAPTSPAISNIVCKKMDEQIAKWAKSKRINYTRYADDLTFSGDFEVGAVVSHIAKILAAYGFRVNAKKTRAMRRSQRQEVVGVVVNEKMQISRKTRRDLRQEAYYIQKYGIYRYRRPGRPDLSAEEYLDVLIGKTTHALFINPRDENLKKCLEIFRTEAEQVKVPY